MALSFYNEDDQRVDHVLYKTQDDIAARNRLVLSYELLVKSIAIRFIGTGEPLDDLVQEGFVGLLKAIDLYDPEKGFKFSTYARHFIIGSIKHALRDRGHIVGHPAWFQTEKHCIFRAMEQLSQEFCRQATLDDVVSRYPEWEEFIQSMITSTGDDKLQSLDEPIDNSTDYEGNKEFILADICGTEDINILICLSGLEEEISKLPVRNQRVLRMYFYQGYSQVEIASQVRLSQAHVGRLLNGACQMIRKRAVLRCSVVNQKRRSEGLPPEDMAI